MKVYKGTDKDIKCRGYQFTPDVEAVEERADLCVAGFHACEAPLDVLKYYAPGVGSRYFEAELEDVSKQRSDDSKVVGKRITLGAEIGIMGLARAHVEWVKANITKAIERGDKEAVAVGDKESAAAGDYGSAAAGWKGSAAAGWKGSAAAGDYGSAAAGDSGSAVSRGCAGSEKNGLSVARGNSVKVKGGIGAVLVIVEEQSSNYEIKDWKAAVVDGETIKADTWYMLKDREFVEVPDND